MSRFVEPDTTHVTRRDFLSRAALLATYCALSCDVEAQQPNAAYGVPPVQALADKNVIHGRVTFKSGTEDLDGYLARPIKKGRFPIVVIVAGNPPYEEYVRNLTGMFAQIGFVGIAPNIYAVQKDATTLEQLRKILAERITDAKIFRDIRSSINLRKSRALENLIT